MDYPQIERFMQEITRLYGDMTVKANRDKAFPNSGMDDRRLFDEICTLYYERQKGKKDGK